MLCGVLTGEKRAVHFLATAKQENAFSFLTSLPTAASLVNDD
jgi:hypothetical protein